MEFTNQWPFQGLNKMTKTVTTLNGVFTCFISIALMLLSGCAKTTNQQTTGFLNNYEDFVDMDNVDYTKVYRDKSYTNDMFITMHEIKLVPFEIWIKPNQQPIFTAEQLTGFSQYFNQQLEQKLLANNYKTVKWAGRNTTTIRGAFSSVNLQAPELSVTDLIPFRIVLNAGNLAYLEVTEQVDVITKVSIEVEFLKGIRKKRMLAAISSKYIDMTLADNGEENVMAVKQLLDTWADEFVSRLVELRGDPM